MSAATKIGLRERKKAQTRSHIADTAMGLFRGQGFDAVTVVEVARAADVGVTTVFNYFPTKEDLFFDRQDVVVGYLSDLIGRRREGESYVEAYRRDMLARIAERDWRAGLGIGAFYRLIDDSPALQARARLLLDHSTGRLVATIAADLGVPEDDVRALLVGTVLGAIHASLLARARADALAGLTVDESARRLADAADRTLNLLAGDLTHLGGDRGA